MNFTLGILSMLLGLTFLFPAIIEVNTYWKDNEGVAIGIAGIITSILMIIAGWAILKKWRTANIIVIVASGSWLVFTSIAGSLHYLGIPAMLLGYGFPIILLSCYLPLKKRMSSPL